MTRRRSTRWGGLALACGLLFAQPARAWELETHVGLTNRAALHSRLDGWLRAHGLTSGLYDTLSLEPGARRQANDAARYVLDDRSLLDEISQLDSALGVSPDGPRQPALAWLLAGAALEGARMDRVRNHFLDPHAHDGALAEDGSNGSARTRLDAARDGSGSVRGIFTGANFDGTGLRADRWIDSRNNALSRTHMLDELERAATAETEPQRRAALARALVCAGSILHVLQAIGDPANARGDFTVNYTIAGAPLERAALLRYGRSVPEPGVPGAPALVLARFFTSPDGTGLGDEVARSFVSPGTLPGGAGALPLPKLSPGPEPHGLLPGPWVKMLATYRRGADGVHYALPPEAFAEAVDALLPRIARRSAQVLDFLFTDALEFRLDAGDPLSIRIGAGALGKGTIALYLETEDGKRTQLIKRDTQGGLQHAELATAGTTLPVGRSLVAVYRGLDASGDPIVSTASYSLAPTTDP